MAAQASARVARTTPVPTGVLASCGAKTRRGKPCVNRAGFRTNHVGQGRCWLHGGATPIKHGRYSSLTHERLRDLIDHHEQDKDPLNILPEIAALRAIFQDYIERYDSTTSALIAWHQSYEATRVPLPEEKVMAFEHVVTEWEISLAEGGEPTSKQKGDLEAAKAFVQLLRGAGPLGMNKPRQVLDIADAYRILGEIGRMVERVEKVRSANAISRPDLNRIMQQMWRSVDMRIEDGPTKDKIKDDWMQVALA